jgi:uncharacterized protein
MDRRTLLLGLGTGLTGLVTRGAHALDRSAVAVGYGTLVPTAAKNTGEVALALPEGFTYTVLGRQGSRMTDGHLTPTHHDGMAAFLVSGKLRLVRNHEIPYTRARPATAILQDERAYDTSAGGGVTTLTIDPVTRELLESHVSLAGTHTNCAGGPTPWGSWLSCEETTLGAALGKDDKGRVIGGFEREHGYIFEVPAANEGPVVPVPLKAMGRFVHEAIAVDPATGIVYLTEDRKTAGVYRFLPSTPGKLAEGGRLQMLMIEGKPQADLRKNQTVGEPLACRWVEIDDPDPAAAGTNDLAVYQSGKAKGAATFARLEGCWWGNGSVYLNATIGGDKELGQVWRYRPKGAESGELVLLFESPSKSVLWNPDNLCVTPRGGLVLCEDTYGGDCFLRGLTQKGEIFSFAQNIYAGYEDSEFAGACFSPDGQTLFVNLQLPGITLAIWGPWERGPF